MRTTLAKSIGLAVIAHEGQLDKAGQPYIFHPLRVMELVRLAGGDEVTQCVAVLHDAVEDSKGLVTCDSILEALADSRSVLSALMIYEPMPEDYVKATRIAEYVDRMTRKDEMSYADYRYLVLAHPVTRLVKWGDTTDNWARLPLLTEAQRGKLPERYDQTFAAVEETDEQTTIRARHQMLQIMGPTQGVLTP